MKLLFFSLLIISSLLPIGESKKLVTTSANPVVFRFEGEAWRNATSVSGESTLHDHMHADMIIDCSMLPLSHVGAVVMVQHKWTLFAAGRWYLFPHAIWKRFHDLERLKAEILAGGCEWMMETRFGLAAANFQWNFGLEEQWIELPLFRTSERLMVRGGGHDMEWIDEQTYQHSFQLKSYDSTQQVGRMLVACDQLLTHYREDDMLAKLLFRRDEAPFFWPNLFLPPWISRQTGEIEDAEVVDIDAESETCAYGDGQLYQPIMFLHEHWAALQLYLLETYKCEADELAWYRIYWMSIAEWEITMKRKAEDIARSFPYLRTMN